MMNLVQFFITGKLSIKLSGALMRNSKIKV